MKKFFFFAAIAAIGLASCSSDETIASQATSESNEISFRPFTTGLTRAVDITTANLTSFVVNAMVAGGETPYFSNATYTGTSGGTFTCTDKHYWPSEGSLDFYAYAPASNDQVTAYTNYKTFTVQPSATAAEQVDLVYAATKGKNKAANAAGVELNFRHTESKVLIKLYNSNASSIDVEVRDASICNVKNSGVFTFADTNTDGNNTGSGTTLTTSTWDVSAASSTNYIQTDASSTKYNVVLGNAVQVGEDWILIPQTFTYATEYSAAAAGSEFTAPCIKVNLKIKNHATSAYIVGAASGTNDGYITALWPLKADPTAWVPGKRYTYTVDLAGGGYHETNTDANADLDPVLEGTEIKFVSVTVDDWSDADDVTVPAAP